MTPEIRHVLFDADGVLQHRPGGWIPAVAVYAGERAAELLAVLNADELASLCGEADFTHDVGARLAEFGLTVDPESFYADIWLTIEVSPTSIAVVEAVRRTGRGVHLATNQARVRAAYMIDELGLRERFDRLFVSAWMGVAKPSPEFFRQALAELGAEPGAVLFIDDLEANVEAARSLGLRAECWHLDEGHDTLLTRLSAHGVAGGDFPA